MLPVSVLASPSTVLRDDLTRCLVLRRPGLAAVVYDVHPQTDRAFLTRTVRDCTGVVDRTPLAPTACCLSCTVLSDVGEAVDDVRASGRWGEVLVALPAALRPREVAAALHRSGAAVDTVTTVVDTRLLLSQVRGDDLLAERGLALAASDRRSTAELVVGQLEDADVLAVLDLHAVGTATATRVQALLSHLAPLAVQVLVGPGGSGCDEVIATGRHDASTGPADRARLAALAVGLCPPACGVGTLLWRSERPLHARRLSEALPGVVAATVRSSGHVWLVDRPGQQVRWEAAGGSLSLGDPQPWAARPGSELVLTGLDLDPDALRRLLDRCVATAEEAVAEEADDGDDPFAEALGPADRSARR